MTGGEESPYRREVRALFLPLALVVGVSCFAHGARAQDTASQDEQARTLFAAGRVSFEQGHFDQALGLFRQAYDLSHRPQLLFNIGACLDRLRQDTDAVHAFEQYLAAIPDAANRAEVEGRIRILRAHLQSNRAAASSASTQTVASTHASASGERHAPPAATRPAPGEEASPGLLSRWWFWAGAGVVVAAVVVAVVFATSGSSQQGLLPGRDGFTVMALEGP